MDQGSTFDTLLWVALVSAAAPLIDSLFRGRLPQVVLLLLGGVLIGPQVLGLGHPHDLDVLAELGLGFLFLIAGYEVEPSILRDEVAKRAGVAWFGSLVLGLVLVGLLAMTGFVHAYVAVSLTMTTTALGILLPLLREQAITDGTFGRSVLATGAAGELFPVLAIAIFLGSRGELLAIVSLLAVGLLALLVTQVPRLLEGTWLLRAFHGRLDDTAQASVRATVLLLGIFLVVAFHFGLDVVLGAFLAGFVLRMLGSEETAAALEPKLDVIGYGFLIPIFFVCSGMALDVRSIAAEPQRLLIFFVLLVAIRGVPSYLAFRGLLPRSERLQLALLSGTALPLLVAITEIGLDSGSMLPANAAALVGAGALTVLVLPATALMVRARDDVPAETSSADA